MQIGDFAFERLDRRASSPRSAEGTRPPVERAPAPPPPPPTLPPVHPANRQTLQQAFAILTQPLPRIHLPNKNPPTSSAAPSSGTRARETTLLSLDQGQFTFDIVGNYRKR